VYGKSGLFNGKDMRYLFFDIECAGVSKTAAKICAFGYCLTDEQFHILEKEDILINPQGSFRLTDRRGEHGLVLPYEYSTFKRCPKFTDVAPKIYGLLQADDTLVVGHATMNDVKYLNLETARFHLPPLAFSFADTQFIYMNRIGEFLRQFALKTIGEELGVDFVPHRAVDDAYATMKIAEAMCKESNCTFSELLKKYEITVGFTKDGEVTQNTSVAQEKFLQEHAKKKEEKERKRGKFRQYVEKCKRRRAKEGILKGRSLCLSHALEWEECAYAIADKAFASAAWWTGKAEECDVYVAAEDETGPRIKSAQEKGARIYTAKEFLAL